VSSFEYISTLLSIIIGLGITHLLMGTSRLINNPKGVKIYWVHLVWTFTLFIYMIIFWWFEYKFTSIQEWTFLIYLFIILYAVLLFLLCVINMPFRFPADFRDYYYSFRKWFFVVLIAVNLVSVFDSYLKGRDHLNSLGIEYGVYISVSIVLCIMAIFSRNRILHGSIAVLYSLYQILYSIKALDTIAG
jgi:cell division protein FtsW (lipid II flippase)